MGVGHGGGASGTPPCAICGYRGARDRVVRHLTHGVAVWLCARHASDAYAVRERGELFVGRLAAAWQSVGALTRRRLQALEGHLGRVRGPGQSRERPGSYSWPKLRREAERRFAAGEPPDAVITELRARHPDGPALVPSVRTMRRWFCEGRWLVLPMDSKGPPRRRVEPAGRPSIAEIIAGVIWYPLVPFPNPRELAPP